jgi:hypothetical protein
VFITASAAGVGSSHDSVWQSPTLRRFTCTLVIVAALSAALHLCAPLEHALLAGPAVADTPLTSLTLIFGLPHFLIGFLFMMSSKSMRGARMWLPIGASVLIGLALCALFYRYGALNSHRRLATTFISVYFFIHIYLDEWHFYCRDRGISPRGGFAQMLLLVVALIAAFEFLMWSRQVLIGNPAYNLRSYLDPHTVAGVSRMALWFVVGAPCAIGAGLSYRLATRRAGVGLIAMVRRDRPLWCVYGLIVLIIIGSTQIGGRQNALVLIHFAAWWIFVSVNLARNATLGRFHWRRAWNYARTTQPGFQVFHGALVLAVLVLLLLYTHNGQLRGGVLDYCLTLDAFYYWTVMHVTISLFPDLIRRAARWKENQSNLVNSATNSPCREVRVL